VVVYNVSTTDTKGWLGRVSGTNIGWDDWVAYKAALSSTTASTPQIDAEQLTLTAITELIRSGRTDLLPNNRKVDERLSVGDHCPSTKAGANQRGDVGRQTERVYGQIA
jgi:hypothetical protein